MPSVYAHISPGLLPSKGKLPSAARRMANLSVGGRSFEAKPHLRGQAKPSESCLAANKGIIAGKDEEQLITPSTMK